jgi:hypothetical protein
MIEKHGYILASDEPTPGLHSAHENDILSISGDSLTAWKI